MYMIPFSFFGASYSKLIASTNGFLSFDVSKTGKFSHFGILKNGKEISKRGEYLSSVTKLVDGPEVAGFTYPLKQVKAVILFTV